MKLGIAIPSVHPDLFLHKFIPSVRHLESLLAQNEVTMQVLFQPPWTPSSSEEALSALQGYPFSEVRGAFHSYDVVDGVPICQIRADAVDLAPGLDVYMNGDDDFEFSAGTLHYPRSSGDHYLGVIRYLEDHIHCGAVMCAGSLGGTGKGWDVHPRVNGVLWTMARGLFIRNVSPSRPVIPDWALKAKGTLEELVMVYEVMAKGFYGAKTFNCPTRHPHVGKVRPNGDALHDEAIVQSGLIRAIREHWNDPTWDYLKRKLPHDLAAQWGEL